MRTSMRNIIILARVTLHLVPTWTVEIIDVEYRYPFFFLFLAPLLTLRITITKIVPLTFAYVSYMNIKYASFIARASANMYISIEKVQVTNCKSINTIADALVLSHVIFVYTYKLIQLSVSQIWIYSCLLLKLAGLFERIRMKKISPSHKNLIKHWRLPDRLEHTRVSVCT